MHSNPTAARLDTQVVLMDSLLDEVAEGRLRIPAFQRPFVWRPDQMLDLFDSIEQGFPIGSLLLWQTTTPIPTLSIIGDVELPESSDGRPVSYLLDGHQRVSTLFGTLRRQRDAPRGKATKDWRWWIYRDLRKDSPDRYRHHRGLDEPPSHFLPLRAVSRTMDFLEFSRHAELQRSDRGRLSELITEAENVAHRIKSYQIPLIRIVGGDLDRAVEVYTRLNRKGMRMEPDQLVSALTYKSTARPTLASRIDEIIGSIAETGFGSVQRQIVFRTVLAVAGEHDIMTPRWEAVAGRLADRLQSAVPRAEKALRTAVAFLRDEVGLPLATLLPYAHQLTLIATFFDLCHAPSDRQKTDLKRWFWVTSWADAFAGANSSIVGKSLDDMRHLASGGSPNLGRYDPQPIPASFNLNSARTRAYLTWELIAFPDRLDPMGTKIDIAGLLASSDSKIYRQVVDSDPRPANRVVLPTQSGMSPRSALIQIWYHDPDVVLASHGIPMTAWHRLCEGDGMGFVQVRAEYLERLIQDFAERLGIRFAHDIQGDSDDDTE